MFVGTFAGLLVIGNLTPIVKDAGLSVELAASAVSVFALGNAVGRILWGFLFDRIKYAAIPASLGTFTLVLVLLCLSDHPWVILGCAGLLGFGFGANFVIYAATLSSHFGIACFPRLYPICFLGYGLAGITGPSLGGYLADTTGAYDAALYLSIAMLAAASFITLAGARVFERRAIKDEEPLVEPAQ